MKLVIVDYGMGNIKSIFSSLQYLGISDIRLSDDFSVMSAADKLILPGVGSFGIAMSRIKEKRLDRSIQQLVIEGRKPILGICLGMQLMGKSSNEDGLNDGLGLVDALVRKFDTTNLKIPHVGFNQVHTIYGSRLYSGLKTNPYFYFTHSYRMTGGSNINQSLCNYGEQFIASFEENNVAGVQFHPELSQTNGLQLLSNFINKF